MLVFSLYAASLKLVAQEQNIPERLIIGVVVDSLQSKVLDGATVTYIAQNDTIHARNTVYGFNIPKAPLSEFRLLVSCLGYKPKVFNFYFNHELSNLNLPPINLVKIARELDEVIVVGSQSPRIDGDTTTFWADNYYIRDFASLKELVKQLEGVSVSEDGSITYNGKPVIKALLNNHSYFQGSIKEALQQIPVSVVKKIQFIEQNEDGTGQKTLKSDNSTQVMNVVTKSDKSAARMFELTVNGSSENQKKIETMYRTIDGSQNASYSIGFEQEPLGIRPTKLPSTLFSNYNTKTPSIIPSEGKATVWKGSVGKSIGVRNFDISPLYEFQYTKNKSNIVESRMNFYERDTLYEDFSDNIDKYAMRHRILGRMVKTGKRALTATYYLEYMDYETNKNSLTRRSGLSNGDQLITSRLQGHLFNYDISSNYDSELSGNWSFKAILNSKLDLNKENGTDNAELFVNHDYLKVLDSVITRQVSNYHKKFQNRARLYLTWSHAKSLVTQIKGEINNIYDIRDINSYDHSGIKDNILSNYQRKVLTSLPLESSLEYTFLKYFYVTPSLSFEPRYLIGEVDLGAPSLRRSDFLWLPKVTLGFKSQKSGTLQVILQAQEEQPDLVTLNPDNYYLDNFTLQIGNPSLRNKKSEVVSYSYSIYLKKNNINFSTNGSYTNLRLFIGTERFVEVNSDKNIVRNMITFVNLAGGKRFDSQFNITKSLPTLKSKIDLMPSYRYVFAPFVYEQKVQNREIKIKSLKLSFLSNYFSWLEINPSLNFYGYEDINDIYTTNKRSFNNLLTFETNFSIFLKNDLSINTWFSSLAQNNINPENNKNTFVVNGSIEKRIFKKKNGAIGLTLMDFTKDNYLSGFSTNEFGYVNRSTSTNSRYLLFQFSWKPQLWYKGRTN